ncbi:uncharacterized protein I206_105721 [Kwoniella pini CBS 10737]|uniref:Chitobiosyldiphosphodolichol beta-mannosyltransferase n=1 Tax=Kwoniella pini CBS 10737 TaxID=1296096 RepID=A0A1B9I3E0_9TREE|nr:uncharacterized protein I206_03376 [Kwoniella pini CBS 10737]OCF50060.1 hypothetical protein I206_03376 [Kwoniella pini CBS 10737]
MDPFHLPGFFPSKPLYNPLEDNPKGLPGHIILPIFLASVAPWTLFFVLLIRRTTLRPSKRNTAIVLVLGDIGRSPRMMYHTSSLSKHNIETWLIGYGETTPIQNLIEDKNVHILPLDEPVKLLSNLPWIFRAPIRILYQIYSIINIIIWKIPYNTEYIFIQNPPSIPTLAISQFIILNTGSKLIIDWHNTGYSLLSMRLGMRSPIVKFAKWIEKTFGQTAYAHLFVTKAMKDYLVKEWELIGRKVVLHDRPPSQFKRTPISDQHDLFNRILPSLEPPLPPSMSIQSDDFTPFTQIKSDIVTLREDRPALVISSTSWTADEDFSLLITALDRYQESLNNSNSAENKLPKLIVIITGKGSLRSEFENEISKKNWKDIIVKCVFLTSKDYSLLLGSSNLGISLHTSSSGMDLPMKIVDMFGSELPVLSKKFNCINELIKNDKNGKIFENGEEMGKQLIDVLTNFPKSEKLDKLSKYFNKSSFDDTNNDWSSWDENWDKVVFNGLISDSNR